MKIPITSARVSDHKNFIAKFYLEKEQNLGFNALLVECLVGHDQKKLIDATRLYFVIEGSGTFTIDGQVEQAELYDLFVIKSGQTYEYKGLMKLIELNIPATDKSNEII